MIFEGILAFNSEEIRDVSEFFFTDSPRRAFLLVFEQILDMKVFVDTDADIRLARRLERDITERGREIEGIIQQYTKFVKPSYDHYIAPTMIYADLIVPRGECFEQRKTETSRSWFLGGENQIAIDLIVRHVNRELHKVWKSFSLRLRRAPFVQRGIKVKSQVVNRLGEMGNLPMPETFYLIEQTAQIKYLHTIVRSES